MYLQVYSQIQTGTDFNNLGIGQYIVSSDAIASTCINTPSPTAGQLIVCDNTGGYKNLTDVWAYRQQYFITASGNIWSRYMTTDGSAKLTVTSWRKLAYSS